jgi:shikimate kinase
MPGSGKSTWGKKLAASLKYHFVDLDELIEQFEKSSISEIFNNKGEEYFRELEYNCLTETLKLSNVVISTGGGTPCFYNNMELMNQYGITFYLNTNIGIVKDRILKGKKQRPLFLGLNEEQIQKKIENILSIREPFYNNAFYTFHIPLQSVQTFINSATQLIEQNK